MKKELEIRDTMKINRIKSKDMRTNSNPNNDGVSRREFLGTTLAGSAALFAGGLTALTPRSTSAVSASWIEATIPELQTLMNSGALTSVQLTTNYLNQIATFNPLLHAVIETNPDALAIAKKLDTERHSGHVRGPLHGIPVLVKDNLATKDKMQTTAGSLALVGSTVPSDSVVVNRLRAAGAVILGKANLSEWANFRGNAPFNGWSARGGALNGGGPEKGFTRDPYPRRQRRIFVRPPSGRKRMVLLSALLATIWSLVSSRRWDWFLRTELFRSRIVRIQPVRCAGASPTWRSCSA
jgi:hypothetical protein